MSRILGIDFGDRRIGLALSDPSRTLARSFEVVENSPRLAERLKKLIAEEEVDRIVLGLPRNMDGTIGPKARQALEFKAYLEKELGLPVDMWDERLTTVAAQQVLREGGIPQRRRSEMVDKVAAQILLQSYLDHAKRPPEGSSDGKRL